MEEHRGREPAWRKSCNGGIQCGRNPVREENCGKDPVREEFRVRGIHLEESGIGGTPREPFVVVGVGCWYLNLSVARLIFVIIL